LFERILGRVGLIRNPIGMKTLKVLKGLWLKIVVLSLST